MSVLANPILYLNMGGEMLYVIHQRLRAQKIEPRKATQVLEDVTAALLNPKIISIIFQNALLQELSWMRSTLESIALSSIMKLDQDSANKLFDLMTMMVKYQLVAATGPREIVLITLNHLDSTREMITKTTTHEWITMVHRTLTDYYGNLTYDEIWQARNDCLAKLASVNVRVSILLRLGLQNEDTTFNINSKNYNEKYEEKQEELGPLKLIGNVYQGCHVGSLSLFGDRVTLLGRNMYSLNYGNPPKPRPQPILNVPGPLFHRDKGSKAEIGLLAKQLGTVNTNTASVLRPFNFDLFIDETDMKSDDVNNSKNNDNHEHYDNTHNNNNNSNNNANNDIDEHTDSSNNKNNLQQFDNSDYKNKLENICADFFEDTVVERKMNLLQLLDETE